MTMPHLMNCSHQGDGWCLGCVKELADENNRLRELVQRFVRHLRNPAKILNRGVRNKILEDAEAALEGK